MADNSVNYPLDLINQQIDAQESLSEYLSKAEALANVALTDDFLEYPYLVVHYYLWALSDIIEKTCKLNEQTLNALINRFPYKERVEINK